MSQRYVRLMKEARYLAWPWMAIVLVGVFSLAISSQGSWGPFDALQVVEFGIFGCLPLLAAMTLGAEFQYNTLSLTLAQPVERAEIWRSKFFAGVIAVLPPAILFCVSARLTKNIDRQTFLLLLAWPLVTTASAFLFTLIARSTIGGFALNAGCAGLAFMAAGFVAEYFHRHGGIPSAFLPASAAAVVCYCLGTVWLGWRMFADYQAVEGTRSAEALLPGMQLVPQFVADWFRCRPKHVLLNLVKRELRLLRPVWPLTFLSVAAWTALATFHALPVSDAKSYLLPSVALTVMLNVLIALLAGSLSLGEEKSWGTHDWYMTLPLSPSVHWFVKLLVAMSIGLLCAAILPMTVLYIAGSIQGNLPLLLSRDIVTLMPLGTALATFAAFWCACLLRSAVGAALLALPACIVIFLGGPIGDFAADSLTSALRSQIDRFISAIGPVRLGNFLHEFRWLLFSEKALYIEFIALFGLALVQSHRLFRATGDESKSRIVRSLLPSFIFLFIAGFSLSLFLDVAIQTFHRENDFAAEVNGAIQTLDLSGATPLRTNLEQLSKVALLSPAAQRGLDGANVMIVPGEPSSLFAPFHHSFGHGYPAKSHPQWKPYTGVFLMKGGLTCLVSYRNLPQAGLFSAICD